MADFEPLRAGLEQAVPFNQHLGLTIEEVALGRGVVALPDDQQLRNHTGTHHASALFAAGQAAAGAAIAAAFVDQIRDLDVLPQESTITYNKVARGPILATAVLGADPEALLAELNGGGRVEFGVDVSLVDGAKDTVAELTVRWLVRHTEEG
jgi:acyl-coenzyme A thioesterase PaaI-like protein